ncbi:imidazoleglycerol-phosphate dehydratase HisB [Salinispira pacifica]|uniref:Imidazoleglycerol-phosphate dehydratase n=1 Tax=Salinispira pacifica TaxID=1307761 RepID=V5WH14_9SPIO|nr:imidazoleglycerol-phosphate dehydratase HisB [Salinispira pacifica]AHC14456.1 Imidazoleglycerol-phosphate dehydratase [Salinispira pacifica]
MSESRKVDIERNTAETRIRLSLDLDSKFRPEIDTPLPFFSHMLTAMAWHGGFGLKIQAAGDVEVDPHHLVEDVGIVLGDAFQRLLGEQAVQRYGERRIPMDDALSEAVIDAANRPFLVYKADFPQPYSGSFDMSLFREFFYALAHNGRLNVHLICHYGDNSHHMIEALFKALGKALAQAYTPVPGARADMSTKEAL